ncbi:TraC family protein [Clostridium estertheticum]|uniref:TraC family protein n=1 Tax=Clostridium estertheticum TaxID=238834 RepID=UPI001C0CB6CC|nr:TraC family protein [Clostridium estertheticum]MBU3173284.1 conjugal transfer protein TraC [Clostridium estertheticum]
MSILNGKKKKDKKQIVTPEEAVQQRREKSAQQWMPITDIEGNIFYLKDNVIAAMLRVQPENIDLLSDREQKRRVESLAEQLNGETEPLQIFCVGRPVDLNAYLETLQEKAKMEQDFTRKMVLKGYIQYTSKMASSGETTERRFYVIITKNVVDSKSESDLINRLNELKSKFEQAELNCDKCNEDELMDVFSLFSSPVQAAFENTEYEFDLPPVIAK